MIHTTLGIDIGNRSIRYAICRVDGKSTSVEAGGSVGIVGDSLDETFDTLMEIVSQYNSYPIDAIGMTVDPTRMLSLHRLLPFKEQRAIEQILPAEVPQSWAVDESAQMAFSVGEFVERKAEGKAEGEGGEEVVESGYDVYILNYPKDILVSLIESARSVHLDPHVMLPSSEAMVYALGGVMDELTGMSWCLLDIGEMITTLYVINDGKIALSRSFKLGGANLDTILSEAFEMSLDEARDMKQQTGFVCEPGSEDERYQTFVDEGKVNPWEVDLVELNKSCSRGMDMILVSVRQTLINFVNKTHVEPERIYLTGGGSKLAGLAEWMSHNLDVDCIVGIPTKIKMKETSLDALSIAVAASSNIDQKIGLNLRRGTLVHKGSLAFVQEKKWLLACLFIAIIGGLIFMTVTKSKMIRAEHDSLKAALEKATQDVFGKKIMSYNQIQKEIEESKGFNFIPEKTAFTHFEWISTQVNDNLSDVEMDLSSLDIDTQRKIVTIRGEVAGDDGLPKFMQQMEQYECFPDEIQEPKTSKVKDRLAFTLRIDANHCATGDDNE